MKQPMRTADTMARVAATVVQGGAAAVRVQGIDDVRATHPTSLTRWFVEAMR